MTKIFLAGFTSSMTGFPLMLVGPTLFGSTLLLALGLALFVFGLAMMDSPDARRSRR